MPDSVVARVADRLDIQPEQTDRVLRTLAQLIKKQSARDGRVRVPGLGVFQQTTDSLSFEPDAALSEAINHRFIGLDPVPLSQEPVAAEPVPEASTEETPDFSLMPPLPHDLEDVEEETTVETTGEEPAEIEAVEEEATEEKAVDAEPMAQDEAVAEEPDGVEETVADEVIDEQEPVEEDVLPEEAGAEEQPEAVEEAVAEVTVAEQALAEEVTDDVLEAVEEALAEEDIVEEEPVVEEALGEDERVEEDAVEEQVFEEEPVAEEALGEDEIVEEEAVEEQALEEEPVAEEKPGEEEQVEEDAEVPEAVDSPYAPPLATFDYNDPDISEVAAYAKWQEETKPAEEDQLSELVHGGTSWSKEDLGDVLQEVDQEEPVAEETTSPELDVPAEEAESKEEEAQAVIVASPDRATDLPPEPPPARKLHTRELPRRRSVLPWILLVSAVIVIGGTLYFMFGPPSKTTSDTPPTATAETPPPNVAEPATPAATDTTDEAQEDTTGETTTAEIPPATPPETTAPSALRIDLARGGYTLVVGSSTEQSVAEAQAEGFRQRFSDLSVPIDVLASTSDGVTRYRVVVGQVPTVEEAVALRDRQSANLPEGTWPTNIARITSEGG